MNRGRGRLVPAGDLLRAAGLVALLGPWLAGCLAGPEIDSSVDPLVVTAEGPVGSAATASPDRAAAVAEMREAAAAAGAAPYPDVFQGAQTARLAAREEPRPVADALRVQAELAELGRRRRLAVAPAEIAALEARAAELRRLAAAARAAAPRP